MPTPTLEIYKGRYYAIWSEQRRSKRKSMGTDNLAVAEARFGQWLALGGHKGEVAEEARAGLTIADLWSIYDEKHVQKEVFSEGAAYAWKNLSVHFGGLTVGLVDQDAVDDYEELRADGDIGRPAKPATVRKELAMLRACLNWHASPERGKRRLLDAKDVPAFTLPEESEPRTRWLTTDEIRRLLEAARAMHPGDPRMSRAERFLWIALETAARKQAILDLTWDRVDFETGMIDFAVPGRKQTKKRRPAVPISNALRPQLERMKREATGPLVMDNGGSIWATVQSAVIRAGLAPGQKIASSKKPKATGISPHTFRHTAATHMARRGVELWTIAGVLGNTLAMVEKVYSKHCPGRLQAAVNSISGSTLEAAE